MKSLSRHARLVAACAAVVVLCVHGCGNQMRQVPCATDDDCDAIAHTMGHRCVLDAGGGGVCSDDCDDSRCTMFDRHACTHGACIEIECSIESGIPCDDPNEYCDSTPRCVPYDGTCSDGPCPLLPSIERRLATVECATPTDVCQIQDPPAPGPVLGQTGVAFIPVTVPSPAERVFTTRADIRFVYEAVMAPTILLVVDQNPMSEATLADHAIWTANMPAGAGTTEVRWDSGVSRVDGMWRMGVPPVDPPTGHQLYLVIEAVTEGRLVAVSSAQFFAFGTAPWAVVGTSCTDSTGCANQDEVLACVDLHCGHLCVSEADCGDCAAHRDCCGDAVDGVRVCVP